MKTLDVNLPSGEVWTLHEAMAPDLGLVMRASKPLADLKSGELLSDEANDFLIELTAHMSDHSVKEVRELGLGEFIRIATEVANLLKGAQDDATL
jgi:hypothetical protein